MNILLSGSTGLIGSHLTHVLIRDGYSVTALVRSKNRKDATYWNFEKKEIEREKLEGFDCVIHLAGESIAEGSWTTEKKARIRYSRVRGTEFLCKTLSELSSPPKLIMCASATGYYGNRGTEIVSEDSSAGNGFLARICYDWEKATEEAKNIRVVNLRFGMILTPLGGALKKMVLPFRMGLGGVLGSGEQYMSCISLDDALGAILHILRHDNLSGPINIVSPDPVTNRRFTKILSKVLKRPSLFPVPSFALRLMFGEMADELLLSGARVIPVKLNASGYEFRHKTLEDALRDMLVKY
ncbi:MAG: TIGR01777 family oxidoreductase [Candidatus Eremiobacterota bacterium]